MAIPKTHLFISIVVVACSLSFAVAPLSALPLLKSSAIDQPDTLLNYRFENTYRFQSGDQSYTAYDAQTWLQAPLLDLASANVSLWAQTMDQLLHAEDTSYIFELKNQTPSYGLSERGLCSWLPYASSGFSSRGQWQYRVDMQTEPIGLAALGKLNATWQTRQDWINNTLTVSDRGSNTIVADAVVRHLSDYVGLDYAGTSSADISSQWLTEHHVWFDQGGSSGYVNHFYGELWQHKFNLAIPSTRRSYNTWLQYGTMSFSDLLKNNGHEDLTIDGAYQQYALGVSVLPQVYPIELGSELQYSQTQVSGTVSATLFQNIFASLFSNGKSLDAQGHVWSGNVFARGHYALFDNSMPLNIELNYAHAYLSGTDTYYDRGILGLFKTYEGSGSLPLSQLGWLQLKLDARHVLWQDLDFILSASQLVPLYAVQTSASSGAASGPGSASFETNGTQATVQGGTVWELRVERRVL